jgi:glucose/arabinose dehydrogenase
VIAWHRLIGLFALTFLCLAADLFGELRAELFLSNLSSPVAFVQDPSNPNVQYVVQQAGRIRVVFNGSFTATDLLNLSGQVLFGGEQGLLGLAFPPDYATSGRFFVYFTNTASNIVIARFRRSPANPLVADPNSRFDFRWSDGNRYIVHPYGNHNGGTLAFGPDGYLYAGPGDGGAANDPAHLAQNPNSLLGKILRLDVNVPDSDPEGYNIPPDNPFLDGLPIAALPEIWAFGVRNPWKFSFDKAALGGTGALIIADVGQGSWEEFNYQPAGQGGRNFGWRNREGAHDNITSPSPAYLPLTDPTYEYSHSDGISITGGYVYRGFALGLTHTGRYFFADLNGRVWSISLIIHPTTGEAIASGLTEHTSALGGVSNLGNISAFGEDANGELYIVSYSLGRIYRISLTCPVSFNPVSAQHTAAGGTGQVTVTSGCAWTAASTSSFLQITDGVSGGGNGIVSYSVASNNILNTTRPARTGTLIIADHVFTVTQSGCSYSLTPPSASFDASGGGSSVTVTAPSGCAWTAFNNDPSFLDITGGSNGTGNGAVTYTVAANAGAANVANAGRSSSLSIGGETFAVTQAGCTFGIMPMSSVFGASQDAGTVAITTASVCSWTVSGTPAWVVTTSGGSGTGTGTWSYSIAGNGTETSRSQTIAVGGRTFSLTQVEHALKRLVPGMLGSFTLTDATDESWTAFEAVEGRSYCAQLVAGPTATAGARPALSIFRVDLTTPLGSGGTNSRCFVAPANETVVARVTQADASARTYRLHVIETTIWGNWWFIGSEYSSYTLLRNAADSPVVVTLTWRNQNGMVVGSQTSTLPPRGLIAIDARAVVSGAISGSVEIGHEGEPLAIVGSQTTLSATSGLSFDSGLAVRATR